MITKDLPKKARIAVAVSGGADSVALLDKLVCLSKEWGLTLSIVHCEHGIRGAESLRDQAFVQELSKKYGLPIYLFSENCPALAKATGESLETAARAFRYRSYRSVLDEGKADYIALAHHRDDEAETVLFRLCRGTSLSGAAAMTAINGSYLRPLLDETKEDILSYLSARGLTYLTDSTNLQTDATRNVLRLDVLPRLEAAIPGAAKNLAAFAAVAGEDDAFLYRLAAEYVVKTEPNSASDTGYRVRFAQPPLFRRACVAVMKEIGIERDYTKKHLQALTDLFSLQTGAKVSLPSGIVARREYDHIAFYKIDEAETELCGISFQMGEMDWGRYALKCSLEPMEGEKVLRFDLDKLPDGCVLRTRKEGDVFRKFGGGEKSLKKYLIDKKIPCAERDGLPVLAKGSRVFAVLGVEIADEIKVTEETKRTAYIALQRK